MEFNTAQFEFAHGHKPRGAGNWAFQFRGVGVNLEPEFAPFAKSFTEAKKWARARAKAVGATRIDVCS